MPSFVFLEIASREVNYFFASMAEIITGARPIVATHLTIRGPYHSVVPRGTLKRCREKLRYDVLRIWDAGRFCNKDEEVVFLRVDSPNLRSVWHKPDYPIADYGFNPHISVYRGPDRQFADILAAFLAKEKLNILCAEFKVVLRVTRQRQLFGDEVRLDRYSSTSQLSEEFLDRLREIVFFQRGARTPNPPPPTGPGNTG